MASTLQIYEKNKYMYVHVNDSGFRKTYNCGNKKILLRREEDFSLCYSLSDLFALGCYYGHAFYIFHFTKAAQYVTQVVVTLAFQQ